MRYNRNRYSEIDELFNEFELRRGCFNLGGGSKGGGAATTSTTVQQQQLSPEQQELFSLGLPFAKQFAETPIQDFEGPRVAPLDPLEQQAQQTALNTTGDLGALAQGSLDTQKFLTQDAFNPESNPGLRDSIAAAIRPVEQQFNEVVLPGIRTEARQAGALGGNRQGIAEGRASEALLRTSGDISANLVNENFQNALTNATRAQFAAPQLGDLALAPSRIESGIGAQRRLEDQIGLDEALRSFNFEQFAPLLQAQSTIGLANQFPGGGTSSTTTGLSSPTSGSSGGGVRGALGGAATGASLGSLAFPGVGTAVGGVLGGLAGFFL